jgi:ribonuclease P protein component
MARSSQDTVDQSGCANDTWLALKRADFAVVLAAVVVGKTRHFVLHHVPIDPGSAVQPADRPHPPELSTDNAPIASSHVDKVLAPAGWSLGLAVPKRHARRAVTRNLLKRQMRARADHYRNRLPPGQWVIRLRAPFDPREFSSAASSQLREAARRELELMFAGAVTA